MLLTLLFSLSFFKLVYAHEALDNFLQDLHTLSAQFRQEQFNEMGELIDTAKGVVYIQRPGKFRWDYQQPYSQMIIADGDRVWIYDVDLEQVTVKDLDMALRKTPALLLSDYKKSEKNFTVNTLSARPGSIRLELKPKDREAQFDNMHLVLQKDILQELELTDNLGQVTRIYFSQFKRNLPLKETLFIFTPPADIDIIDESE